VEEHPEGGVSVQGRTSAESRAVLVAFSGELDAADPAVEESLLGCAGQGADFIVVDLLNVSFVDSSVIRALVLAHRQVEAAGGWVRVVYTHHVVRRVIEMCGLAGLFPQYSTVESALRGFVSAPPSSELGKNGLAPA
jgi:anti-anti-sigma factor